MLYDGELVFDDSTPDEAHEAPEGCSKGWLGRPEGGYAGVADSEFPQELLIPRNEWQARAEELESQGLQLSQKAIKAGLPCKDQANTNYCWINAPTHTVEVQRLSQNEPMVILSPASAGCYITDFRNIGGWGSEALQYIIENGLVPVDHWPANAIDRRYDTVENRNLAKNYRVEKWLSLQPRNLDQLVSLLFRKSPVAVAYNWWGHEVTAYEPVWVNGQIGIRCRNSWGMSYGSKGFFTLQGNKMLPDDAVSALSVTPG